MNYYPPSTTLPIYGIFTVIGIALTAVRLWARKCYLHISLGIDDWLMVAGMFLVCCCTTIQFYNALEGVGGQALSSSEEVSRISTSRQIDFAMITIEKPAFGAIKLSLLYFYKRIFRPWPSFNRLNNIFIIIIILWFTSFMFADLLLCGANIQLNWAVDQSGNEEYCGDRGLNLLMFAVTSVITDLMVLALPFQYIQRLQLEPQKKTGAAIVIFLGLSSTLAGVLRTIFLCIAYPLGRMDWGYTQPPNYEVPFVLQVFNPTFYVMIEMLLGTWAANLPPLAPLLRKMTLSKAINKLTGKTGSRMSDTSSSTSDFSDDDTSFRQVPRSDSYRKEFDLDA